MYTYGIIKGEKALLKYCQMRWNAAPQFTENFSHNLFTNGYIESICAKDPTDDGYKQYYILAMQHPNGEYADPGKIRDKVYEDIRTGRYSTIKGI